MVEHGKGLNLEEKVQQTRELYHTLSTEMDRAYQRRHDGERSRSHINQKGLIRGTVNLPAVPYSFHRGRLDYVRLSLDELLTIGPDVFSLDYEPSLDEIRDNHSLQYIKHVVEHEEGLNTVNDTILALHEGIWKLSQALKQLGHPEIEGVYFEDSSEFFGPGELVALKVTDSVEEMKSKISGVNEDKSSPSSIGKEVSRQIGEATA